MDDCMIPRWDDWYAVLDVECKTVGSPLDRVMRPELHVWSPEMEMLRLIEYNTRLLAWAWTGDHDGEPPELIPMANDTDDSGSRAVDIDQMDALLGWSAPEAEPSPEALDIEDLDGQLGWRPAW